MLQVPCHKFRILLLLDLLHAMPDNNRPYHEEEKQNYPM